MTSTPIENRDAVLLVDVRWGAGMQAGTLGLDRAIEHGGWSGSCGIYDPATKVDVGYRTNRMGDDLDPRGINLVKALYESL